MTVHKETNLTNSKETQTFGANLDNHVADIPTIEVLVTLASAHELGLIRPTQFAR